MVNSLCLIWEGICICDGQRVWLSAVWGYRWCSGVADGAQCQITGKISSEYQILGDHILHQIQINLPVMIHYFDAESNVSFICFSILLPLSFFFFCCFTYFCLLFSILFFVLFSLYAWCYTSPCAQHVRNEYEFCPALTLFLSLAWIIFAICHILSRFHYINWRFY